MTLAKDFITAYTQIEKYFSRHNNSGRQQSFSNHVHHFSKSNNVIRQYRDDLLEYGQLRNAIVHDRVDGLHLIAEPHPEVVKQIQYIAKLLLEPPTLRDFDFKPLLTCQLNDNFSDVLKKMNDMGYSQVPVCEGVMVKNLLSTSMIVHYMYQHIHKNMINLDGVLIKDVLEDHQNHYRLVHVDESLLEVIEMFGQANQKGQHYNALIVLDSDSKKKGPIGIVTHKDLPTILDIIADN